MRVGNRLVGPEHPPFVVAEMSGNHNQSLQRALDIVDAAAAAGAHAVKIQTYTAETMTLDVEGPGFAISDPESLWHGKSLHALYQESYTPWDWHEPIFARCRERGIVGFSSPFDASAVEFLETLDVPCYKIASFENTDIPLIEKAAATGKPLIISTGMATENELRGSVDAARSAGCRDLILLKCTSTYPASPANTNLQTVPDLAQRFSCLAGLSDHTAGIGAAVASVAMGAVLIEKHFTLRRADGGVDSAFSLEPEELRSLVIEAGRAWEALGTVQYGPTHAESGSLVYRRSLYIVADVQRGDILTPENMRAIRPGYGLPPRYYERLLGKTVKKSAARGTPLSWELVDHDDSKL